MKVSWNWLSDTIDLGGLTPDEVGQGLTFVGVELDGIERVGDEYEGIVVGEILSVEPHPDADKLTVCRVDTGDEPLTIVCGAHNMKAGDHVPVIPAGRTLPTGQKIKRGKIRGQLSEGMMCSEVELALGDDHSGLLILDKTVPIGQPIGEALDLTDVVLDFEITPNRGDCLSYLGMAREMAAKFGKERRFPGALDKSDPLDSAQDNLGSATDHVEIRIEDEEGCPRYAGSVMLDVTVGPSPKWLARRLEAIGQRPVNNIVDVTNYVLFETGQPLHAFDLDLLRGADSPKATIVVRDGRHGDEMESIDHQMRRLQPGDVLITDGQRPVAIGGVMGGVHSEVSDSTRNILIECAHFNPTRIRRTARRLALGSESSFRFERYVDIFGVDRVMRRTVELILACHEEVGFDRPKVAQGMVDVFPNPPKPRTVELRPSRANLLLGIDLSRETMVALLENIELPVSGVSDDLLVITVPSFRPDLEREVDLIEEVGRLYGLDRVQPVLPSGALGYQHRRRAHASATAQPIVSPDRLWGLVRTTDRMAHSGLFEAVNYSFTSPSGIDAFSFGDIRSRPIEVANPLSEEWAAMRTSLLPGLLSNVAFNAAHRELSVGLFEVGPVFLEDEDNLTETGVKQELMVAAVLWGQRPSDWAGGSGLFDVFDLKTVLLDLGLEHRSDLSVHNHGAKIPYIHPGIGGFVEFKTSTIGVMGQIHPKVADHFGIDGAVFAFEISLDALLGLAGDEMQFQPVARFPATSRDLALVVDKNVAFGDVEQVVKGFHNELIESIQLSSVYEGAPIEKGKKCIALSIAFRSSKGSLTDKKVDSVHDRLAKHVCSQTGGELR